MRPGAAGGPQGWDSGAEVSWQASTRPGVGSRLSVVESTAIEGYKNDIKQATAEAERYNSKVEERKAELRQAQQIIADSKRRGEILGTTREDVIQRKGACLQIFRAWQYRPHVSCGGAAWFDAIQDFHGWKLLKVSPDILEMRLLPMQMQLTMHLKDHRPVPDRDIAFVRTPSRKGEVPPSKKLKLDQFPAVLDFLSAAGVASVRERGFTAVRDVRSSPSSPVLRRADPSIPVPRSFSTWTSFLPRPTSS